MKQGRNVRYLFGVERWIHLDMWKNGLPDLRPDTRLKLVKGG